MPICNYLAILTQLGACIVVHVELPPRLAGGPNLLDSESSDAGILLSARHEQVGHALQTHHYVAPDRYHDEPSAGTDPASYPISLSRAFHATRINS